MCWCAVKKLLTHSYSSTSQNRTHSSRSQNRLEYLKEQQQGDTELHVHKFTLIALEYYYGRPIGYGRPLYFRPVVSSFFFFFASPIRIRRILDVYHTSFHTWCGLSANLECRSEMCCTRLAENTGRKKKFAIWAHRTTFSGCVLATKACIDNRK